MTNKEKLKALEQALKEAVRDALAIPEMKKIAQTAAEMIRTRTRIGYGSTGPDSPNVPLAPLKNSTKATRKRAKERGDLSSKTTHGKSNLTHSGELLDSIEGTSTTHGEALVQLKGTRNGSLTNEELAEFMEKGSAAQNRPKRPFMNLTRGQVTEITKDLEKRLFDAVTRRLTRIK